MAVALSENRGETAKGLIAASRGFCYIHAINAYEVASKLILRGVGELDAWDAVTFGGVVVVDEIWDELSRRAVRLKVAAPFLSLGDCHCLAFAEEMGGRLATTDMRLALASKTVKAVHVR